MPQGKNSCGRQKGPVSIPSMSDQGSKVAREVKDLGNMTQGEGHIAQCEKKDGLVLSTGRGTIPAMASSGVLGGR